MVEEWMTMADVADLSAYPQWPTTGNQLTANDLFPAPGRDFAIKGTA